MEKGKHQIPLIQHTHTTKYKVFRIEIFVLQETFGGFILGVICRLGVLIMHIVVKYGIRNVASWIEPAKNQNQTPAYGKNIYLTIK